MANDEVQRLARRAAGGDLTAAKKLVIVLEALKLSLKDRTRRDRSADDESGSLHRKWEVPVIYEGLANFIVTAKSYTEAIGKAISSFDAGEEPDKLGNEYEKFSRVGAVKPVCDCCPEGGIPEADMSVPCESCDCHLVEHVAPAGDLECATCPQPGTYCSSCQEPHCQEHACMEEDD